jgi:hypothetical protein
MQSFRVFNICLLSLVILFGSILTVQTPSDFLTKKATEESREIEVKSTIHLSNSLIFLSRLEANIFQILPRLSSTHSQIFFSTNQLLTAYRIALPPPLHT